MPPPALRRTGLALGLALAVFLAIVLKNAWICDDAYITFRTSQNLADGYGATWNVAERVQAYTNPLWMLLCSAAFALTQESFYTGIATGAVVSLLAVLVVSVGLARTRGQALFAIALFACSRAFTDFSTSGLEDPLGHLLLALFALVYIHSRAPAEKRLLMLSVCGALLAVNRLDNVLLVLPALAVAAWSGRARGRSALVMLLGFTPLLLWVAFTVFYYGLPVPNTALVKLDSPLESWVLLRQGLFYLFHSLTTDPLTLLTITAGFALAFRARDRVGVPLAIGGALYLLYVVKIGGDFMSGRHLTSPFLLAVVLLAHLPLPELAWPRRGAVQLAIVPLLALLPAHSHLLTWKDYGLDPDDYSLSRGVCNERAYYFPGSSLLNGLRGKSMPSHEWAEEGRLDRELAELEPERRRAPVLGAIGFRGYFGGPRMNYLDQYALADPLLARLPSLSSARRIGHYARHIPLGYQQSLADGNNSIADASLAEFYERVRQITRGPLLDRDRLVVIWRMATGAYEPLLQDYLQRPPRTLALAELERQIVEDGVDRADGPRMLSLPRSGILIELPATRIAEYLRIELDSADLYQVRYLLHGEQLASHIVGWYPEPPQFADYPIEVPEQARAGFDALLVAPYEGSGDFLLGGVAFPPGRNDG